MDIINYCKIVSKIDDIPEIPGYIRRVSSGVVSADAAKILGRAKRSPVVYYLRRAQRAYWFEAVRKERGK